MANVGEKGGLGAVDLGERFGSLPFLLVRLGVGDAGGDLSGHQIDERAVLNVERPQRAEAEHQPAALRVDRQRFHQLRLRRREGRLRAGRAALQLAADAGKRERNVLRARG